MQQKQFKLTKTALDQLKEELEYLKTVREREVAEQIKEARSFGDLSENSEYDEAKNEQGKLYSRIAELENIITNAVIIEEAEIISNEVYSGCRVKILCLEDNEEEEYQIVGTQEADPRIGNISDESPLGKALIGTTVGDEITVNAAIGPIKYRVIGISH